MDNSLFEIDYKKNAIILDEINGKLNETGILKQLDDYFNGITHFTIPTKNNFIDITRIETKIGNMYACATELGVCMLEFTDRRALMTELHELMKYFNADIFPSENAQFVLLRRQLNEYFNGERKVFDIKIYSPGTPFQQKVWERLNQIPYGKTISYKSEAQSIGMPESVRAVANANGKNRISILIPCHRVIGEDGSLTGYGGGLNRKRFLIDFEKNN